MYGRVTKLNLDLIEPYDIVPVVGDEIRLWSAARRVVRGYVVRNVRKVNSTINLKRYALRMMEVPLDQLVEPMDVIRYRKHP